MKKLIFTLSMLIMSIAASAQYTKSIHLTTDDGTDVRIALSRALMLTFKDGNLTADDGKQQVTISLEKVKIEYSTEEIVAGIVSPQLQQEDPILKDGFIVFQGLKAGQSVRVYTADGKLVTQLVVKDGCKKLDLSQLPKGVTIIQAGQHSLKYNRR